MLREISLIVHLVGVVVWIGGSATGAWTAAQLISAPSGASVSASAPHAGLVAVRKALLALTMPGILLAWAGGLTMFVAHFETMYAHAGWMHGKVALGVVASGLHGALVARVRKASDGTKPGSPGLFAGLAMGIVLVALVVVALVILKPGG